MLFCHKNSVERLPVDSDDRHPIDTLGTVFSAKLPGLIRADVEFCIRVVGRRLIQSNGSLDLDFGSQCLAIGWRGLDFPDDVHPLGDNAKRGKTLTVGVSLSSEIEFGLIANADKKLVLCGIWTVSSHRDRAVDVLDSGVASSFQLNWLGEICFFLRIGGALNDGDLDRVVRLVVLRDGAMKTSVGVKSCMDEVQEISHGFRSLG